MREVLETPVLAKIRSKILTYFKRINWFKFGILYPLTYCLRGSQTIQMYYISVLENC